ncbi:purine nucleoside permease [Acidithiobacillus ferrooxidans]|jgi:purine nucleoside permease|uniref:purine nucleoside permease n=2 Tax=Acidithiobacillaceae TaxID=225058 RepID=UPI001CDB6F7C|nr:purine nucleoside permease [Acidithiobacillus ferrooxidans]MCR0969675.1 purine nucleoside permease [Acidithiobacillus ferrooxidans]MCR1349994.1 purine nucleoside permease [Acidithiobacillus ferrooxidans]UBU63898.1 purine nucleoside permease [Acidithiobacillus ferrooxidans]
MLVKKNTVWKHTMLYGAVGFSLMTPLAYAQAIPAAAKMRPKVIVLTAFPPEWQAWTVEKSFQHQVLHVPGLIKPLICDSKDVCVTETGEGEINAAVTVTSLVKDAALDVKKTIFIRSGIAGGVDEENSALGSVYINNWVISWAFGHHYLSDQKQLAWSPPGCTDYATPGHCGNYTRNIMENLAYKINPALLNMAVNASAHVALENSTEAKKLDKTFAISAVPKVMVGATITGNDFWIGKANQAIAEQIVRRYTHGEAKYTNTAMEDLGDVAALSRFGLADHYLSIRGISDVDVPPPGKTEEEIWKTGDLYASALAERNAVIVTEAVIAHLLKGTA